MVLRDQLLALGACEGAIEWVGDRTIAQAWSECTRGDWLLWYAGRSGVDRRLLVEAACACAGTALQCVPVGEDRPRLAIEAAEAWCRGEVTIEEVREAEESAWAVAEAERAWPSAQAARAAARAARATWADPWSAEAAAELAWSARAAMAAAEAAAWAKRAAMADAAHVECARLVRELIPCPGGIGGRHDVS